MTSMIKKPRENAKQTTRELLDKLVDIKLALNMDAEKFNAWETEFITSNAARGEDYSFSKAQEAQIDKLHSKA